ncbi:MAG: phenylalanine--tRNA ligase subunit alpha, partial [marine benthic group bacterium]|nr:phenylalanine--tRNA ligase subunit alpha [Gemmatimonadota bacterium]
MANEGPALRERLEEIRRRGVAAFESAESQEALEAARIEFLGRGGLVSRAMSDLKALPAEEKPATGQAGNRVKKALEALLEVRSAAIAAAESGETDEVTDLTLPGRRTWQGGVHPVTRVIDEVCEIFREIGFTIATGPEIESDWHNFTSLNIPLDHPAADMHDTFYLDQGVLLRTHTSPVQARIMLEHDPPVRVLAPGLVFRRDPWDASHAPAFEQIEGLAVDEGIDFVEFRAAIDFFVHRFFGTGTRTRFRPSYFPFTEP